MAQAALNKFKQENEMDTPQQENVMASSQEKPTKLPTYQCLKKGNLFPNTFTSWLNTPGNVYIGGNIARYSNNPEARDVWVYPPAERGLYYRTICRDEYMASYEDFIRHHRWDELDMLYNKCLGCWCVDENTCHFKVISMLLKEKQAQGKLAKRKLLMEKLEKEREISMHEESQSLFMMCEESQSLF